MMKYPATVGIPYQFEAEVLIRINQILSILHIAPNMSQPNFEAVALSGLDEIATFLQAHRTKPKPARIMLGYRPVAVGTWVDGTVRDTIWQMG